MYKESISKDTNEPNLSELEIIRTQLMKLTSRATLNNTADTS